MSRRDPYIARLAIALAGSNQAVKSEQARDGNLSPEATAHLELIHAVQAMLAAVVEETKAARDVRL